MNELQAAYGLLQLKYIDGEIAKRRKIIEAYRCGLEGVPGIWLLRVPSDISWNYGYFPIFLNETLYGKSRDELYENLKTLGIFCRRYFHPLISQFSAYRGLDSAAPDQLPVATIAAQQIICLPVSAELTLDIVNRIVEALQLFSSIGRTGEFRGAYR